MQLGLVDIFGHKAVWDVLIKQNFENQYLDSSSVMRLVDSSVSLQL